MGGTFEIGKAAVARDGTDVTVVALSASQTGRLVIVAEDQRSNPQAGEPMAGIVFPALSESSPNQDGVVSTWFAEDCSRVSAGDLVAEVAVDKVE